MATILKPCPYCKGTVTIRKIKFPKALIPRRFAECDSCHYCGRTARTAWGAILKWNKEDRDGKVLLELR